MTMTEPTKMTLIEAKTQLAGATLVFWRAGCDCVSQSTGRKAHRVLNDCIQIYEEGENTIFFSRVGKTVWLDEQSWIDEH